MRSWHASNSPLFGKLRTASAVTSQHDTTVTMIGPSPAAYRKILLRL
jgi:hypothetical protein